MNRTELIDLISVKADLTKASASKALDAMLTGMTEALQNDNPVMLVGFGTFTVKKRAARKGRNPLTGKEIMINETKVVGFKAGKVLKEAVKEEVKA